MSFHKSLPLEKVDALGYVMPSLAYYKTVPSGWKFHDRQNPCKYRISSGYYHYQKPSDSNGPVFRENKRVRVDACVGCFSSEGVWVTDTFDGRTVQSAYLVTTSLLTLNGSIVLADSPEAAIEECFGLDSDIGTVEVYELNNPTIFKQKAWVAV